MKNIIFTILIGLCFLGSAESKDCLFNPQKSQAEHYLLGYFYFMEKKMCKSCKIEKHLTDFYLYANKRVRPNCKDCCLCLIRENYLLKKPKPQKIDFLDGEIWKDVVGWEGLYRVSNMGRLLALEKKYSYSDIRFGKINRVQVERLIKFKDATVKWYRHIKLSSVDRESRSVGLHVLVAEAFIPNPENKPQVNHINGIKADNRVENLEWFTCGENVRHAIEVGLNPTGENKPNAILTNQQAREIKDRILETGYGGKKLHKLFYQNISVHILEDIVRGRSYKYV